MSQIQQQIENIPGYDIVMDKFNEYAGDHFNGRDPFEDEEGHKVKLNSELFSKQEQKAWKSIQSKAWVHDKCFLGSCGVGMDCGVGLAPLASFFLPAIGPIAMYVVHARLIEQAKEKFHIPSKLEAKMQSQIMINLLVSLPPIIGAFFTWLNGCLTKNAAMIFGYLEQVGADRKAQKIPTYLGTHSQPIKPSYAGQTRESNYNPPQPKKTPFRKPPSEPVYVGQQQSGVR